MNVRVRRGMALPSSVVSARPRRGPGVGGTREPRLNGSIPLRQLAAQRTAAAMQSWMGGSKARLKQARPEGERELV